MEDWRLEGVPELQTRSLKASRSFPEAQKSSLGSLLEHLESFLTPGGLLGTLGAILGALGGVLGASWEALGSILEPSWYIFGAQKGLGKHLGSD